MHTSREQSSSKTRLMEQIEEDLGKMGVENYVKKVKDRNFFKKKAHQILSILEVDEVISHIKSILEVKTATTCTKVFTLMIL